ncbi:MAG: universal stress protein [SAR324 cluster bacterium]|nr:universal stress protein [SAR324 cluster bacterium]
MEKLILVPIDNSDISTDVVLVADQMAKSLNAEIDFLHIAKSSKQVVKSRELLEKFLAAKKIQAPYHALVKTGKSYAEIVTHARETKPDMVMMGAHSHSLLGRLLLGSNTDYVLHHNTCPVYIYKKTDKVPENRIIVPIDYQHVNLRVIEMANDWAKRDGSELVFLHVDESPEYPGDFYAMETGFYHNGDEAVVEDEDESTRRENYAVLQKRLEDYVHEAKISSTFLAKIKFGTPYLKILELQKEMHAKLIMLAAHSQNFAERLLMGGNTDYVVHHATCSVIVYRN